MNWIMGGIMIAIVTVGWSLVTNLRDQQDVIAELRRKADLTDSREASYVRRIERRDAAIAASACKAQIERWVRNPDEVPQPFNPFNQL